MKSNRLLKWLTIPAVLAVIWLGFRLWSGADDSTPPQPAPTVLSAEESRRLAADADTPRDTVATLVAQVKELRGELKAAVDDNAKQRAENERLRLREGSLDQRIGSALTAERERWQKEQEQSRGDLRETRALIEQLQGRVDSMNGKAAQSADLPIGLGLEEDDAPLGRPTLLWIEPRDTLPNKATGSGARTQSVISPNAFPTRFGEAPASPDDTPAEAIVETAKDSRKPSSVAPVYTAPDNSTLLRSVAMTALIGRVPVEGAVSDPYPFKVLVGADNLTANGYELSELAGAVMSGTATGDWTLSCVRGQIHSITFVFEDGTVRSLSSGARAGGANRTTEGGLGWISDPYGIPCVSGQQVSNAKQYLTTQTLITAAGAAAAAAIDSDSGRLGVVNAQSGDSLGTVGISGNEALQHILAGGVQDISQWVERLYGQAHAAIVVPPQAEIAVHLNQPLEIDRDHAGRKVHHGDADTQGAELD